MNNIFEQYENCILESLGMPYPYKWKNFTTRAGHASFKTKDGRSFDIEIDRYPGHDYHEIQFIDVSDTVIGTMGATGGGDQFKIFATVFAAVSEYVKKFIDDIETIRFEGEKPGDFVSNDKRSDSAREKLYTRFFKKYTPPGKWDRAIRKEGWRSVFIYTKV